MPRPPVFLPLAAVLLASCASVPVPATRSTESPAHAAAPEAATPPAVPGLSGETRDLARPPVPGQVKGHAAHGTPETARAPHAAAYVCPMHPQVTSEKPGVCPICGMTLVATQAPKDGPR